MIAAQAWISPVITIITIAITILRLVCIALLMGEGKPGREDTGRWNPSTIRMYDR
jgi:hypothetical protein